MATLERAFQIVFTAVIEHGAVLLPLVFLACLGAAAWIARRGGGGWRPRGFWRWAGVVVCLLVASVSTAAFALQHRLNRVIEDRVAGIRLELLPDGPERTLADYRGQVVVLNFWATWCPPCRKEMPDLNRLADAYRDSGVVVLTVSDEPREAVDKYTAEHPLTTENALFTDAGPTPQDRIGNLAYDGRPTTLILDRDGRLRRLLIGAQSFEVFSEAVERYL